MLSSYLICRDNIFIFGVFWVFPSSGPFLYEEHFVTLIVGCWVIDVLLFWKCFWKWVCWFIFFNIFMVWPVYYPDVLQFWTSCIWGSLEMLLQWSYDKFSLFWEIMARIADWLRENMWRLSIESERLSLPYSVAIFVASNYFLQLDPMHFSAFAIFIGVLFWPCFWMITPDPVGQGFWWADASVTIMVLLAPVHMM